MPKTESLKPATRPKRCTFPSPSNSNPSASASTPIPSTEGDDDDNEEEETGAENSALALTRCTFAVPLEIIILNKLKLVELSHVASSYVMRKLLTQAHRGSRSLFVVLAAYKVANGTHAHSS
jgi:hypothetical protein